jgi:hypothetical protein
MGSALQPLTGSAGLAARSRMNGGHSLTTARTSIDIPQSRVDLFPAVTAALSLYCKHDSCQHQGAAALFNELFISSNRAHRASYNNRASDNPSPSHAVKKRSRSMSLRRVIGTPHTFLIHGTYNPTPTIVKSSGRPGYRDCNDCMNTKCNVDEPAIFDLRNRITKAGSF